MSTETAYKSQDKKEEVASLEVKLEWMHQYDDLKTTEKNKCRFITTTKNSS